MENLMDKATISTEATAEYTREIGKMGRNKDLGSWSSMTNMDIVDNGRRTRKMGRDLTFTPMERDTRVVGSKTRRKARDSTSTRIKIPMMETGKMTGVREKEP